MPKDRPSYGPGGVQGRELLLPLVCLAIFVAAVMTIGGLAVAVQ